MAANDFPVGFIFFLSDFQASEAMAFCFDEEYDVLDIFQFGHNIIGFYLYSNYEHCMEFCLMRHLHVVSYKISSVHLYTFSDFQISKVVWLRTRSSTICCL